MQENNKYYTPTIEEFHIGFEYQRLINNKWIDEVYEPWDDFLAGDILFCISEQSLRVKYLDKEDIESLGFKDITLKESLSKFFIIESKQIRLWKNVDNTIFIYKGIALLFHGKIKNKSELKRLMKQLGMHD